MEEADLDTASLTPAVRQALVRHRVASLVLPKQRSIAVRLRLKLLAELRRVNSIFEPVGIETRVLKGLATAALDYPTKLVRHTGDVDLLVLPESIEQATELLLSNGFQTHATPGTGQSFAKGQTLVGPSGIEIDLHTRLNRFVESDSAILFSNSDLMPDDQGRAFSAELRLVHAASHALLTPPGLRRLSGFIDISVILDRQEVRLDETLQIARSLNVEGVTGAALRLEAVISGREATYDGWREPIFLERAAFVREERNLVAEHLYALAQLPPAQRVFYLWDWAPGPSYLRQRGGAVEYFGKLFSR